MGCRRDATFSQVLEGGPVEGHRTHLSLRSVGGRLLHSLGAFAFEDKPRLGCADLSILSEVRAIDIYLPLLECLSRCFAILQIISIIGYRIIEWYV